MEARRVVPVVVFVVLGLVLAGEGIVGYLVYEDVTSTKLAVLSAAGAIIVLASLDYLVRIGEHSPWRPRWFRRFLPAWCFAPFLCAIAGSVWMHYEQRHEALDQIESLANDLRTRVPDWTSPTAMYDAVDDIANARFRDRHEVDKAAGSGSGSDASPKPAGAEDGHGKWSRERNRFVQLARVVGEDLRHTESCWEVNGNGDQCIADMRAHLADGTITSFLLPLALQSLLILWFPALLAVSVRVSLRRLEQGIADDNKAAKSTKKTERAVHNMRWSVDARDYNIIAEDRALFIPRLFFAMILLLGTTYIISPLGMKASYLMAAVDEHGLPGQTSWSLWSTDFTEAPVVAVGFVGYLLYAIITATQRFIVRDLDDRSLLALLVRGVIVLLLSLALSSTSVNDTAARAFVFIAGVFPIRALESLAKRANVAMDPDFGGSISNSFEGIPNLDPAKVFAMRAAGIDSVSDLATMPIRDIAERVRVDLHLLARVVDRAVLIDAIGLDLTQKLEPLGVTSATELVDVDEKNLACIVEKLGHAPELVAHRLRFDGRMAELRRWVTNMNVRTEEERLAARARRSGAFEGIKKRLGVVDSTVIDAIKAAEFISIHDGLKTPLVLPYSAYDSFSELLEDVFPHLGEGVHLHEYGREWALYLDGHDEPIQHVRELQRRDYGSSVEDHRPLARVGIEPGAALVVRRLEQAARPS